MKLVKSSILIFSVLFLFIGTIGIDVFSHLCQENEMVVSYFVEAEDHCGDHEVVHTEPCCEDTDHEPDCCDDELYHVQLKLDFFNEVGISLIVLPEFKAEIFLAYEEVPTMLEKEEYRNNSPPPQSGRDLILEKQYWLI